MYGLFVLLFFYLLGCAVSALTGHFIPGSVAGMILLFAAGAGVGGVLTRYLGLRTIWVSCGLLAAGLLLMPDQA